MNTSNQTTQETPSITMNNKTYPIDTLPGDIKELIGLYQSWENELIVSRRESFKLEAALKGITTEIEIRLAKLEDVNKQQTGITE